jgi:uncharacterized protein with HEPN domain
MPRAYKLYLQDIVNAAHFIEKQTTGLTYEALVADELRLPAILHNLTVIGEAIKHVPDDIRQEYDHIPWREIAGTRDVIVHGYFALNLTIIWHAVTVEVPQLRRQIEEILNNLDV